MANPSTAETLENAEETQRVDRIVIAELATNNTMFRKFILFLTLVSCAALASFAQETNFTSFKQELMPKVDRTITVDGVLASAKLGWLVQFKGWGVYLYSADAKHIARMNALDRFSGKSVRVTGKLHYFPEPTRDSGNEIVARAPEHFYFDLAEAKVELINQDPAIRELLPKPRAVSAAPAECLATFRQFFNYVQHDKPSIVIDESAQQRWLSKNLRDALKEKVATFKDQPNDPDFPGNATFVGTWDKPSTFTILGSRRYSNRAVIDVWYAWDKGTNYPGDTRLSYFMFVLEDGRWKLDDMYTFRGEFATAESLNAYLRSK